MRASVCLSGLILVLPAVFATGVAQAKIKPIPRPAKIVSGTAAGSRGTLVAPIRKPVVHTRKPVVRTAVRTPRARARTSTRRRLQPATASRGRSRARVVARSRGGRHVPPARSHGGRRHPLPLPVVPEPTPLGLVAIGEALPSSDEWPAWVFSLLGVLAASEVYLLVHLVRARELAEA
jgi:hypothetical protein